MAFYHLAEVAQDINSCAYVGQLKLLDVLTTDLTDLLDSPVAKRVSSDDQGLKVFEICSGDQPGPFRIDVVLLENDRGDKFPGTVQKDRVHSVRLCARYADIGDEPLTS